MATTKMPTAMIASLVLWLAVWTMPLADTARILAVETVAGKSHWYFMSSVLRSLTEAGHTVTVFTPFPDGDRANYTEVDTSHNFPMKLDMDVVQMFREASDPIMLINTMSGAIRFYCDAVYGDRKLTDLMASGIRDRYDLLIIEPLGIDCVSHLAASLGLPVIYSIPSPMITYAERLFTGHLSNPATVSNMLANHAVPGTFVQRLTNTGLLTYGLARSRYDRLVTLFTDAKPYDLAPTVNPSIIFQNSHYITESSRPVTPNVVYVGGIHLKPLKTIPKVSYR